MTGRILCGLLLGWTAVATQAAESPGRVPNADWPQWLGPERDGVYHGNDLAPDWPKDGPPTVWSAKVGQGFSGPVVAQGRLVLHHRLDNEDVVQAFDAATGKEIWKSGYPTKYRDRFGFDEGPRATPLLAGGRAYTFSAEGKLHCFALENGARVWSLDTQKEFAADLGFFGLACSPLLEGRALMLNIGGRDGAGIVALDKDTGKLLWKSTDQAASYSSPVAATLDGHRLALFFNREGLVAVDPSNGMVRSQFPWRPDIDASVNAATPLVINGLVFISTSYDRGAALLRYVEPKPEVVWATNEALSNHYSTSVHHAGYLYGFDGRQERGCTLRCVELKTGKVAWSHDGLGAGSVTLAGGELLVLTERGELIRAPASPAGCKPIGQARILGFQTRAYPALARGRFYARDKTRLVCVDLSQRTDPK